MFLFGLLTKLEIISGRPASVGQVLKGFFNRDSLPVPIGYDISLAIPLLPRTRLKQFSLVIGKGVSVKDAVHILVRLA